MVEGQGSEEHIRRWGGWSWPSCWLCTLFFPLFVLPPTCTQMIKKEMFLNSHVHCGHGDMKEMWYSVDKTSLYNVRDDVNPVTGTHAFRECELVFQSTRRNGQLCMLQRSLKFDSCHVQLELYDGWMDVDGVSEPNRTLNCDHGLMSVEWCTSGRYLTIRMSQIGPRPSVRDLEIDLLVYDMQSIHRKASMDSLPSCGSRFVMDGSVVNVTNLDPDQGVKDIFPECTLTFEYVGRKENRSLCMVFEPSTGSGPSCSQLNYTLNVYEFHANQGTGSSDKVVSSTRSCDKPLPRQWCSNSTKISLELHRRVRPGETVAQETQVVFYALVLDHEGGPETLPLLFTAPVDTASPNMAAVITAVVVSCILFITLFLVLVVFLYRRYRRAGERDEASDHGAGMSMLDGDGNGHCRSNGQNCYTKGPPPPPPVSV